MSVLYRCYEVFNEWYAKIFILVLFCYNISYSDNLGQNMGLNNDLDKNKKSIDPRFLMAVERSTITLIGLSISMIVFGFVVEKFELFLYVISYENKLSPEISKKYGLYRYLGVVIILIGMLVAIYSHFYHKSWIKNLEKGSIETDKRIFLYIYQFL
jgi:uncharacterized membrane protein YidH (DUF202 family)